MQHQEQFDNMTPEQHQALKDKLFMLAYRRRTMDYLTDFERYAHRRYVFQDYPTLKTFCEIHLFANSDCSTCEQQQMECFLRDIDVSEDNPRQHEACALCDGCGEYDECFGGLCRWCHTAEERPHDEGAERGWVN
jgi:hypothetical protein